MIQVGNGSLQEAEQEYGIKEFDDLMHEVEQMKEQIRNLIDDVVEKEKVFSERNMRNSCTRSIHIFCSIR